MKHDCHYHPGDAAKWHCGKCLLYYCPRCMPDADTRRRHGLCPHCGQAMRYLGAATTVVPFWNRIRAFFRYPFHRDPLLVVAICTLVPLVLQGNLIGLVVTLLLVLALFKYTYAVIRRTADGHMEPPPLATAFSGSGFDIVLLQLIVFFLMGCLVVAAGMLAGPLLMLLVAAFLILALPASIMVLAMEHSVVAAISPLNLAVLMSHIGWPYFVLYGYVILLIVASGVAQQFAMDQFEPWVAGPLSGFLNSTFTLILFHMLGYLLFQYQEELGFASDFQEGVEADTENRRDRSARLDADIDMNLKDGNYDRVLGMLKEALQQDRNDPRRLEQLYRLTTARGQTDELMRYHPHLLEWLASRNDSENMVTLLGELDKAVPGFRLDDPELTVTCARTLYQQGHYRRALKLLQDFHRRFPDHEALAPAYILVAQALANGMAQWDKAASFLNFVRKRCPDHPLHKDLDAYLQQVANREPVRGPQARFPVE